MADLIEVSNKIQNKSDSFNRVLKACSILLKDASEAKVVREELSKRLGNQENKTSFEFGYFPKDDELGLLLDLVSIEDLKETNLIYQRYSGTLDYSSCGYTGILSNHQLIMPYKNLYGDILGIVGRTTFDSNKRKELKISKYKNTSLPKNLNLFGLYEAKKSIIKKKSVIIVEGQFDCITSHRFGHTNTVALGSASLTAFNFFTLKRYTNNFKLLLDNDKPGEIAVNDILNRFGKDANFDIITLPSGYKDIDEYLIDGNELQLAS